MLKKISDAAYEVKLPRGRVEIGDPKQSKGKPGIVPKAKLYAFSDECSLSLTLASKKPFAKKPATPGPMLMSAGAEDKITLTDNTGMETTIRRATGTRSL